MKRGGPLRRGAPLARRTPMPPGKGFAPRPFIPARALHKSATTARPSAPRIPAGVVRLIKERSEGLCEVGLVCGGVHPATESAHRMGKGSGGVGPKNSSSNVASNLLRACHRDHAKIDNAQVSDAERLGLKVRHGVALPREIPVFHVRLGWVLLDDEGGWTVAPDASVLTSGTGWLPVVQLPVGDLSGEGVPLQLIEAMDRYGHLYCGGWSYISGEALHCGCGGDLFIALEVGG